jgi:hypothetical protein
MERVGGHQAPPLGEVVLKHVGMLAVSDVALIGYARAAFRSLV